MIGPLFGALLALTGAQPATDIGPIIQSRCVPCHRDGGDAPFSLETIDDVRRRAATIVAVTKKRYMPPWKPVPGFGEFQHSRRMNDSEIALIERWVTSGMAEGTVRLKPDATSGASGQVMSGQVASGFSRTVPTPDVIIELPSYTLSADGPDVFRNFVVPVPAGAGANTARIVRALQFRPRSRGVHHANIRVDATPASRTLDEADPAPGYEGVIARSADFPDGQFLGWTPGQLAPVLSDGTSWRLPAGSDLVVQLHLRPTGAVEQISPDVALYFGERLPSPTPVMIRIGRQNLDIPPGAVSYTVTDSFVLPVAVKALAVQAHAHYRARSVDAYATRPDGARVPLLRINEWDAHWQDRYTYQQPVALPAGTRITSAYVFDNASPDRVQWGWRSSDEMGDVWLQVMTSSEADRAALRNAIVPKMLTEDAIGSEVLLAREPNHVPLRNDAAQIYLALGKPFEAVRHFAVVTMLQPNSAAAWFNEGTALEALGRTSEAKARYLQALRADPGYSPALNNSGVLQLREGRVAEARDAFTRAVAGDPSNADAHANLGLVLIATGQPDAGIARITRALEIKPELLAGMSSHVWLLAANADRAARRPVDALALAERIIRVSADRAGALDLLGACQAANGEFDSALQTAGAALKATPAPSPSLRDAIQQRIALYRNRRPFVLTP